MFPMVAPGPQGLRAISSQLEKTVKQMVSSSAGWNPNDWEKLPQWEDVLDAAVGGVTGLKTFVKENYPFHIAALQIFPTISRLRFPRSVWYP